MEKIPLLNFKMYIRNNIYLILFLFKVNGLYVSNECENNFPMDSKCYGLNLSLKIHVLES